MRPTLLPLVLPTLSLAATFASVPLTAPLNWISGSYLFPGNIIAGYNAELSDYNASSWGEHVLEECKGFTACTSANVYQATNSGSTGGQYWFGYVFRGGPTNESFYERYEGASDAAAWTIVP